MRVFVTGASGVVGRRAVPLLVKAGHRVTAVGRTLVDAALAEGVARLVQESFAPLYPDRGDDWIDEQTPLAPISLNRTVVDAETSANRFTASGRTGVVLRFAAFYGPDAFTTRDMAQLVRRGWAPIPGRPEGFLSSISHDDAATAVVAALELPAGAFNVTDDEPVRRRDFADAFARSLGVAPPRFMPPWVTALMGALGGLLARSERMSNRKLRTAAPTWVPRFRSVREGLPHALAASEGMRVSAA